MRGDAPGSGYWERRWAGFREGSARIGLEWEGGSAGAVLYEQGVPLISNAILEAVPFELTVMHVAWSGDMLMGTAPTGLDVRQAENDVRMPREGDLGWDPKIGELTFTYGLAECHTPAGPNTIVVCGSIDEDSMTSPCSLATAATRGWGR